MAETKPPDIRSVITDDEFGGFRITIPPSSGGGCCGGCVFALWALVMAFALLFIASDPAANLTRQSVAVLGILLAIGLCFGIVFAAAATAREVLMIEGKTLVLRREVLGFCRQRNFELAEVRNLRAQRTEVQGKLAGGASVAFDHGGRTYHFGSGLSLDEARRLVKTIRARFPIRDDWDNVEPLFPTES
jgi:hypothetical protein